MKLAWRNLQWVSNLFSSTLKNNCQEIVKSLVEDGWTPFKSEAENVEEKLSIEEVFLLVDINKSGFVSKTVQHIFNFLFSFIISYLQEIKLASKFLKRHYGMTNVRNDRFFSFIEIFLCLGWNFCWPGDETKETSPEFGRF